MNDNNYNNNRYNGPDGDEEDTRRQWHDDDFTTRMDPPKSEPVYTYETYDKVDDDAKVRRIVREEFTRNYKPKNSFIKGIALVLAGAILGSAIMGAVFMIKLDDKLKSQAPGQVTTTGENITINTQGEVNVETAVAAKAKPSVVGITTLVESTNNFFNYGGSGFTEGVGSGVIVSADGYILTNSHVVSDGKAVNIDVLFSDDSKGNAKLLWNDATLDLAIIKVEKTGLTPVEMGDSDGVKVGNKAIAIGNPLGLNLQSTLTSGYISGLDRTISMQTGLSMEGLIQTDAAINQGNSGGALLDAQGKLIGINTAKAGQSDGIGFAIPINMAKPIIEEVIATGSYDSVYLGISGIDLEVYAKYTQQELPKDKGIFIHKVSPQSPAAEAGIREGDIILQVDGKAVSTMSQLKKQLLLHKVGNEAKVTIFREGKEDEVTVKFTQTLNNAITQNPTSSETTPERIAP